MAQFNYDGADPRNRARFRFGSARYANARDFDRAGMFALDETSLMFGFLGKRMVTYSGPGGAVIVAGARAGKLRDILAFSVCNTIHPGTMLILDLKGEEAAISQDQTPDRKHCIYWNPRGLHGLPRHRLNPVGHLIMGSPTLYADIKQFVENLIPLSGSAQGEFFELRAREFLEGICLTLVKLKGVLTFPDLYHIINLIPGNSDEWIDFAYEMHVSGIPLAVRVEQEIAEGRNDSGGGFRGILGELFKSVSALSDPELMASVSPPFNFDLADFCRSDQRTNLYLMPPAETLEAWGPVVKAIFVGAMALKSRAPSAPRQTWVIDEAAQLKKFPLLVSLYSLGAGLGIRPLCVFQSTHQMKTLGPDADNIIMASAALRCFFGVRDIETATTISRMSGSQTFDYVDPAQLMRAEHARRQTAHAMLSGSDPIAAAMQARQQMREAEQPRAQQRNLITADEVMTLEGKAIIFADGLPGPGLVDRRAYYEQRFMAGRYHPNPYHPPADVVRVKTLFGYNSKRVIREPVPTAYADYPQYQDGFWSRIED
ncbi:MAG: type IV secretory system conjugative DNA transfer family protein [Pseudomonadota bacterium]